MSMLGTKKGQILEELLSGKKMMTELKSVVSSYDVLRYNLLELQTEGYILKTESRDDKRRYFISLTEKGREVADKLKKAEAITRGQAFPATDSYSVILYLYRFGPLDMKEVKHQFPVSNEILKELEELKVVRKELDNSSSPLETSIVLTEKGKEMGELIEKLEKLMYEPKQREEVDIKWKKE